MASTAAKLAIGSGAGAAAAGGGGAIYLTTGSSSGSNKKIEDENLQENIEESTDLTEDQEDKTNSIKSPTPSLDNEEQSQQELVPEAQDISTEDLGSALSEERPGPEAIAHSEPEVQSNKVSAFSSRPSSVNQDTFSGRYWLYLVEPEQEGNKEWWNKKYEELNQEKSSETLDNSFKQVTEGHGENTQSSLNKVCASIYSREDTTFEKGQNAYRNKEDNFLKIKDTSLTKSFWKYCSLLGERPQTLKDTQEYSHNDNLVNHFNNYSTLLVSQKEGNNEEFWKTKEEWYSKVKSEESNQIQKEFKEYVSKKSEFSNKEFDSLTLKEICPVINQEDITSNEEKIYLVLNYCSFLDYDFKQYVGRSQD